MTDRGDPSPSETTVFAMRNVRRSFDAYEVRQGVGFDIPTVEITGLIGPPGQVDPFVGLVGLLPLG
jgi:hypothetical protein